MHKPGDDEHEVGQVEDWDPADPVGEGAEDEGEEDGAHGGGGQQGGPVAPLYMRHGSFFFFQFSL